MNVFAGMYTHHLLHTLSQSDSFCLQFVFMQTLFISVLLYFKPSGIHSSLFIPFLIPYNIFMELQNNTFLIIIQKCFSTNKVSTSGFAFPL